MAGPKSEGVAILAERRAKSATRSIEIVCAEAHPALWDLTKSIAKSMDGGFVAEGMTLALMQCAVGVAKIDGASWEDCAAFLRIAWVNVQKAQESEQPKEGA